MEIFAKLKSYSFYHKSEALYVSAEVLNFVRNTDENLELFKTVDTGKTLSFKYTGEKIDEFIEILKDQVVFITTSQKEPPRDQKFPEKFIIDTLRRCDIFKACS